MARNRFCIAILALGGQGGGVLADWIQSVARGQGWLVQGTSVPGVAQRTGSTVYYVELARRDGQRAPVMAQMPVPGDVDIVIASELMETGRAMLRGFTSPDRTTLIGSTHRIYAISEKAAMGDGRGDGTQVIDAAAQHAKRFIGFDMDQATRATGSVISSVMFGALAGSGALPFARDLFEAAIRDGAIAVDSNLRGFDEGFRRAQGAVSLPVSEVAPRPQATTEAGRRLQQRILAELPAPAQTHALHGVQRLMDYQDAGYAALYLDRLASVAALDQSPFLLTTETARHLALWMSYEDIIRVADLKTRSSRFERVKSEVQPAPGQLMAVTEFLHPRLREVCDILPAGWGRFILGSPALSGWLQRFFQSGRHAETTSLTWFLLMRAAAQLRRLRTKSLRFGEEQQHIEHWLERVRRAATLNAQTALELVLCQRLIKGYGDTWDRGWRNFQCLMSEADQISCDDASAAKLRRLRDLALADDKGSQLADALGSRKVMGAA